MRTLLAVNMVAACGLFCCLASPACAQVQVSVTDPHAAAVRLAAARIPAAFVPAGNAAIVMTLEQCNAVARDFAVYGDHEDLSDCCGMYLPTADTHRTPEIWLVEPAVDCEGVAETLSHEWGHHVYFTMLTPTEQSVWLTIWLDERYAGSLPSEYAGVSYTEGAAESFRCYVMHERQPRPARRFWEAVQKRLAIPPAPTSVAATPTEKQPHDNH